MFSSSNSKVYTEYLVSSESEVPLSPWIRLRFLPTVVSFQQTFQLVVWT